MEHIPKLLHIVSIKSVLSLDNSFLFDPPLHAIRYMRAHQLEAYNGLSYPHAYT